MNLCIGHHRLKYFYSFRCLQAAASLAASSKPSSFPSGVGTFAPVLSHPLPAFDNSHRLGSVVSSHDDLNLTSSSSSHPSFRGGPIHMTRAHGDVAYHESPGDASSVYPREAQMFAESTTSNNSSMMQHPQVYPSPFDASNYQTATAAGRYHGEEPFLQRVTHQQHRSRLKFQNNIGFNVEGNAQQGKPCMLSFSVCFIY